MFLRHPLTEKFQSPLYKIDKCLRSSCSVQRETLGGVTQLNYVGLVLKGVEKTKFANITKFRVKFYVYTGCPTIVYTLLFFEFHL